MQKEVIQLEREKSELSTELKSTKVLSYQQLSKLKLENANRISDLEYSIAQSKVGTNKIFSVTNSVYMGTDYVRFSSDFDYRQQIWDPARLKFTVLCGLLIL